MTCKEKLVREHPEWSDLIVLKCILIFTPSEYFCIENQELDWDDGYPLEDEEEELTIEKISEHDAVIAEYLIKQADLKREFEVLKTRAATQEDTIKNLMKNNADLRAKLDEKEEQLESYRKTNEELGNNLAAARIEVCSSSVKNDDLDYQIRVCDEEISKLTEENSVLRKRVDKYTLDIAELNKCFNMVIDQRNLKEESLIKAEEEVAEKNKLLDEQLETINQLNAKYNESVKRFEKLKENIEELGLVVDEDNNVIVKPDKLHSVTIEEIADHFNSCSTNYAMHPTDIARGIARSIRNKYDALIYVGFSHDDAMTLLPKWEN